MCESVFWRKFYLIINFPLTKNLYIIYRKRFQAYFPAASFTPARFWSSANSEASSSHRPRVSKRRKKLKLYSWILRLSIIIQFGGQEKRQNLPQKMMSSTRFYRKLKSWSWNCLIQLKKHIREIPESLPQLFPMTSLKIAQTLVTWRRSICARK